MTSSNPHRFLGIVTDDAANVKRAREIICNEHYNWIQEYGCICHSLSLLVEDFLKIKTIDTLRLTATEIVKQINNSHVLHAAFERIQKEKKERCWL